MSPEKIVEALQACENHIHKGCYTQAKRHPMDTRALTRTSCMEHLLWMVGEAKGFAHDKTDKANRWLGFIQGVLWAWGEVDIETLANQNKEK